MSEPVSVPGLHVELCTTPNLPKKVSPYWPEDGREAWRVIHRDKYIIPCPFARQKDAERAMLAIADMTDWTADRPEIARQVKGRDVLRRMIESLAW